MEWYVKMNTPGVANGIMAGWIDGELKYLKTNVLYRQAVHDNLHVRTVWLNVHSGGEGVGPPQDTAIFLDQLVLSTDAQPGPWQDTGVRPAPPTDLRVQ
jgi:hypothetical protein